MERHASALKAARQAIVRTDRNQSIRSECKTAIKKLQTLLAGKKKDAIKEQALPMLNEVQKLLMRAANKKIIKRENASRKVSRLHSAIHKATV